MVSPKYIKYSHIQLPVDPVCNLKITMWFPIYNSFLSEFIVQYHEGDLSWTGPKFTKSCINIELRKGNPCSKEIILSIGKTKDYHGRGAMGL